MTFTGTSGEQRTRHVNPKVVGFPAVTEDALVADITKGLQAVIALIQMKVPQPTAIFHGDDNMAAIPVNNRIDHYLARIPDLHHLDVNNRLASSQA